VAVWNDERLERIIAKLLRAGVLLSAAVVLLGGICHLAAHAAEPVAYRKFQPAEASYRSLSGITGAVARADCRAVIQLGLVLLIATPVARVAFSLVAFAFERDRTYVFVTLVVLAVLLYSLIFSH
jgi:uncharacterized membrane protein